MLSAGDAPLDRLAALAPPPPAPDPPRGVPEAFDGRVPAALAELYARYGAGTFRASAADADARSAYVALLDGAEVTSLADSAAPLEESYDVADLLRGADPASLTAVAWAWLGVFQPGEELWWWRGPDGEGAAFVRDRTAIRVDGSPAAILVDVLRQHGAFEELWGRIGPARFYAASALDPDGPVPETDRTAVDAGLPLDPARERALAAVRLAFVAAAPALGAAIGAALPDVGPALRARLERLPAMAQAPWEHPWREAHAGLHLVEQVLLDLADHLGEHLTLPGVYQGLLALHGAGVLLDFLAPADRPPAGLPADLHLAIGTYADGARSAWLEATPGAAAALALDRGLIAMAHLGLDSAAVREAARG